MPEGSAVVDASVATRQCGRCRESFPGDPTLPVGALQEWWLCPPCHAALFVSASKGPEVTSW